MPSSTRPEADVSDTRLPATPSTPDENTNDGAPKKTADEASSPPSKDEQSGKTSEDDPANPALPVAPDVPIIPEVRKCSFEQFVNRFSLEETGYAVEYLEAGAELGLEMTYEVTRRHRSKVKNYEDKNTIEYKSRRFDGGLSSGSWIQAVRIQSRTILKALSEVSRYPWGTEPHTFMRPFSHLIHFHPKIQERLESLKAASSTCEDGDSPDSQDVIKHLECYVSFVETHLLPLARQFDDATHSNPHRIRHDDLWYLFRPGELIYVPLKTLDVWSEKKVPLPKSAIYQNIWKLEVFQPHDGDLELPMRGSDPDSLAHLYFIDYDGSSYKTVSCEFSMKYFSGEKEIRNLEVYPVRFAPSGETLIKENRRFGQHFIKCIEQRHVSYKAWTLANDPLGRPVFNAKLGKIVPSPEFIDGDVMIDFQEAFNAHPMWKYSYGLMSNDWTSEIRTTRNKFPILLWSDASRSKLLSESTNVVVADDDIAFIEGTALGRKDPYGTDGLEKPQDEDVVLLPRRLCGYGLRERTFILLDVKEVKTDREDVEALNYLQIDPHNKRMIDCLLTDHFNTKQARKVRDIPSQDPIPGKGRNLVFLLHGPPGVGKTATVEAMAQKYQKPLFSITSGDLGSTPDAVESSLTEIFHLANVWDCILLLDEADVFLEERERSNLKRNAVVSVFLRVMEYYSGILFLTTNRPGQLDEAIKSRVHSVLLYNTLTLEQTREIFNINIERLEYIEQRRRKAASDDPKGYLPLQADRTGLLAFAEKHWKKHDLDERGRWNGRQIRNAFISAAALARSDATHGDEGREEKVHVAVLTERHFETVASSITAFDRYMASARGALDSERAADRLDRHDHFDSGEEDSGLPARNRRQARNSRSPRVSVTRATSNGAGNTTPSVANHYTQPPPTQPAPPPPFYGMAALQPQHAFAASSPQQYAGVYPYAAQVPNFAAPVGAGAVPGWPQTLHSTHPYAAQGEQQFVALGQQQASNMADPRMMTTSAPGAATLPLRPGAQDRVGGVGASQLGLRESGQDGQGDAGGMLA